MNSIFGFGASVRGPGHIRSGMPNQDSFLIRKFKNGWVAVVSDGVGSRPFSDVGSRAVCKAVASAVSLYLNSQNEVDIKNVLRLVHARWLFEISPNIADECNATVLFAVITQKKIILATLGDGMICCRHGDETTILTDNKTDSFSNVTTCMKYKFSYDDWNITEIPFENFRYVALATDGISDDVIQEKLPAFVDGFVCEYSKISKSVRTKKIKKMLNDWPVPKHSDDKTIACIVNA